MTEKPSDDIVSTDTVENETNSKKSLDTKASQIYKKNISKFKPSNLFDSLKDNTINRIDRGNLFDSLKDNTINRFEKSAMFQKTSNQLSSLQFPRMDAEKSEKIHNISESVQKKASKTNKKFKKEFKQTTRNLRENLPKAGKKIKSVILTSTEEYTGSIVRGRQYGRQSITILQDLGKLWETGLITEDEYKQKKKELLRRI